jgi:WD40 repeat protein
VLVRPIGQGSYGQVWLALNLMGEPRAVKVIHRARFGDDQRLYDREMAGIRHYEPISRRHESLVQVLHIGQDTGCCYCIMELADAIDGTPRMEEGSSPVVPRSSAATGSKPRATTPTIGAAPVDPGSIPAAIERTWATYRPRTLDNELKLRGRLRLEECVDIGLALTEGLEQIHAAGLVHRDVKPSNVIFIRGQPKLADIGLVTLDDATHSYVGTEGYVPPEGPGRRSSDLYGLGKILYEISSGLDRKQYPSAPEMKHWPQAERNTWNELNAVVIRACNEKREERHRDATELRAELLRLKAGVSIDRERRMRRALARLVAAAVVAGLVALVAAVGFGVLFYRYQAATAAALAEVRKGRQERLGGVRRSQWFAEGWSALERAARLRDGSELLSHAAAMLAGWDSQMVALYPNAVGGSAAFHSNGTVAVGGDASHRGRFIDALAGERDGATELHPTQHLEDVIARTRPARDSPVAGEGPLAWTAEGVPVQVLAASNGCALVHLETGARLAEFAVGPGEGVVEGPPPAVAVSPDAAWIAAATEGGRNRVVLWDSDSVRERAEPRAAVDAKATCLAFAPGHAALAVGGVDGVIQVLAVPSLEPIATLPARGGSVPVRCLAVGRDPVKYPSDRERSDMMPLLVAAGYRGGEIVIWEVRSQLPRSLCLGSPWMVASLAFHPDNATLVSAGRGRPTCWDTMTGRPFLFLEEGGMTGEARALAIDPDGSRVLVGAVPGAAMPYVTVWALSRHRGVQILRGPTAASRKVWISTDQRWVAAISDNWQLGFWDIPAGRLRHVVHAPIGSFLDCAAGAFDPERPRFAVAAGTEARVYNLEDAEVTQRWSLPSGRLNELGFDGQGGLVLARSEGIEESRAVWRLYELSADRSPILLHSQTESGWSPLRMVLTPSCEHLILYGRLASGRPHVLRGYEVRSGREVWRKDTTMARDGLTLQVDPSGRRLLCTVHDELVNRVFRLPGFAEIEVSPKHCGAVGPLSRQYAVHINLEWEIFEGGRTEPVIGLGDNWEGDSVGTFSRDGSMFVWGTREGPVLVAYLAEVRAQLGKLRRR